MKVEKVVGKPKKGRNHVPGPGTYKIGSVWELNKDSKIQDI